MTNTQIWDSVYETDPKHTKEFTKGGGFKGTAIKPLYLIHRATELWGPIGDKWGAKEVDRVLEQGFIFMKIEVWYPVENRIGRVEHWGGDVLFKEQKGALKPNDEAFKMAFTDAIGKCLVQLGFSADVHMGEFNGNKYVDDSPKAKSPFSNAALRKTYCENVIKSLNECETIEELNTIIELNKPKFSEMKVSDNEHDALGVEELQKHYRFRLVAIKGVAHEAQMEDDYRERQ